jgi:ArsR family transcriptional regulator, arsenate/arsenite/antimonite-responsive transcriptional repressor
MNMSSYSCCSPSSEEFRNTSSLSIILKLVSEDSRLRLLCILRQGEHCVCELMEHVDMSQSLISHHLKDLKDAGVVADEKRGLRVYYSLTKEGRMITDLFLKIQKTPALVGSFIKASKGKNSVGKGV